MLVIKIRKSRCCVRIRARATTILAGSRRGLIHAQFYAIRVVLEEGLRNGRWCSLDSH
jgi:hypothetical protein